MDAKQPQRQSRGIYLLPNLLTTAALFAGFFAIISAMNGRFVEAAIAIFLAMIFDGLDGRTARLMGAQSAFGAEYDSLSDMVSFGVAPAVVIYAWSLSSFGKFGWPAAFLFTACAAARLARFNTQIGSADKRYFQGLASPAAAALIAGLVWAAQEYSLSGEELRWLALVVTLVGAWLMVSNIRYHSFKEFGYRNRVPFIAVVLILLVFVLVSLGPPLVLFLAALLYAASGVVVTVRERRQLRARRKKGMDEGRTEG